MIKCPRLLESVVNLPNEYVKQIRCGDHLLLHNGQASFWAEVVDVKNRGYFDTIISSRLEFGQYSFGDLIRCHQRHIYNINKSDNRQYS